MIRFIIFAVLAYLAYRYLHNWYAVAGVAVVYLVYLAVMSALGAKRNRERTSSLLSHKLSDEEKAHLGAVADHQRAMDAHKAQFDPDLRKKL